MSDTSGSDHGRRGSNLANLHGMRRGTHACVECRRRRAKCNYSTGSPPCENCEERGDVCRPQVSNKSQKPHSNATTVIASAIPPLVSTPVASPASSQIVVSPQVQQPPQMPAYSTPLSRTSLLSVPFGSTWQGPAATAWLQSVQGLPFGFMNGNIPPSDSYSGSLLQQQAVPTPSMPVSPLSDNISGMNSPGLPEVIEMSQGAPDKTMVPMLSEIDPFKDVPLACQFLHAGADAILGRLDDRLMQAIVVSTAIKDRSTMWAVSDFPPIILDPQFSHLVDCHVWIHNFRSDLDPRQPATSARALATLCLIIRQGFENSYCRPFFTASLPATVDMFQRLACEMLSLGCPEANMSYPDRRVIGIQTLELLAQVHKKIGRLRTALLLVRRAVNIIRLTSMPDLSEQESEMALRLLLLDAQLALHLGVPVLQNERSNIYANTETCLSQGPELSARYYISMVEAVQSAHLDKRSSSGNPVTFRPDLLRDFPRSYDVQSKWILDVNYYELAFYSHLPPLLMNEVSMEENMIGGVRKMQLKSKACLEGIMYARKMLQTYLKKHEVGGIPQIPYDEFLDFRAFKVALILALIYLSPLGRYQDLASYGLDEDAEDCTTTGWDLLNQLYEAFEQCESEQAMSVCQQARQLKDLFSQRHIQDFEPCALVIPYFGKYKLTYEEFSQNTVLEISALPYTNRLPPASELSGDELLSDWTKIAGSNEYHWRLRYTLSAADTVTSVIEREDGSSMTWNSNTGNIATVPRARNRRSANATTAPPTRSGRRAK